MAYYIEDRLSRSALGARRPMVNDYFLSTYTVSIYDGCEFGCPYCDGWSFRTRPFNETIRAALDLPDQVASEIEKIRRDDLIGITALTDPYQPAEATYRLTRQTLRILANRGQPTLILTKSPSVLEDLVLLEQIQAQSLAVVMFTLLTTDLYLAEKLEDKTAVPALRLDAIAELKRAGIPVGVALIPIIPYVNDTDLIIDATLRAIASAGADFVVWEYLTIPDERHRARINEMLTRIGRYPPNYYRDLYGNRSLPDLAYRHERDRALLSRCDALNLSVRAPHSLYAGKLAPRSEAALLLKHAAFRDAVQGREHLARYGHELATLVFRGIASEAQLRESPLFPVLRPILSRTDLPGVG
ncbi:MAG: radical SAM protein [Roseiflexaceae bacterium]|nr:radical SAM protein [Roseiflexaceae bacterium]